MAPRRNSRKLGWKCGQELMQLELKLPLMWYTYRIAHNGLDLLFYILGPKELLSLNIFK